MKLRFILASLSFLLYSSLVFGQTPTGGTITTDGSYSVHTFTSSGTFTAPSGITAEVLVVAGGGGGWKRRCGDRRALGVQGRWRRSGRAGGRCYQGVSAAAQYRS